MPRTSSIDSHKFKRKNNFLPYASALISMALATLSNTPTLAQTVTTGTTLTIGNGNNIPDAEAITVDAGGTLRVDGGETIGSLAGAGTVELIPGYFALGTNNTDTEFSGNINATGSSNFTKFGTGTLTLSGTNNVKIVSLNGGKIIFKNGTAMLDTGKLSVTATAILELQNDETLGILNAAAGTQIILTNSRLTFNPNATEGSPIQGVVSGTGGITIGNAGNASYTLSGSNTYTGETIVNGNILKLQNGAAIANSGKLTINTGGTVELLNDETIADLRLLGGIIKGTGTLTADYFSQTSADANVQTTITAKNKVKALGGSITNNNATGIHFASPTGNASIDISENITGTTAVLGTLSNHVITFTSTAIITGKINITGADKTTSKFTNNSIWKATGGASTFDGILDNKGTINLQNGVATDSISSGNLILNAGSTLKIDIDKDLNADVINVTGTVALDGILDIIATGALSAYSTTTESKYTLIANDGTDPATGNFSAVTDNYAFLNARVEKNTDGSNDVVLKFGTAAAAPTSTPATTTPSTISTTTAPTTPDTSTTSITPTTTSPTLDFKPFSTNSNHTAAAKSLEQFDYTTSDGQAVYNAIVGVTDGQAKTAIAIISGSDLRPPTWLNTHVSSDFQNAMMKRAGSLTGVSFAPPIFAVQPLGYTNKLRPNQTLKPIKNVELRQYVWADIFASHSSIKASTAAAAISSNSAGLAIGGEIGGFKIADKDLTFGISTGYIGTNFSTLEAGSSSQSHNIELGLYGAWGHTATNQTGLGITAAANYSQHYYQSNRALQIGSLDRIAIADYKGHSFGGDVKLRYGFGKFFPGSKILIAPISSASFSTTRNDAYSETGAGSLNISSSALSINKFSSLLGLEIANQFTIGHTKVNGAITTAWKHEFGDANSTATYRLQGSPTSFSSSSPLIARDSLSLKGGLNFVVGNQHSFSVSAMGNISKTSLNYGAEASFKYKF